MRYRMWYSITVRDSDGRVVYRTKRRAHTLTRNFALLSTYMSFPKGDEQLQFILVESEYGYSYIFVVPGSASIPPPVCYAPSSGYAIQLAIGSGTTPFSRYDYRLAQEIASFPASTYEVTDTGSGIQLVLQGSYTAQSDITISEVGIYGFFISNMGPMFRILLARDVLSSPVSVSAGQTVTVKYTIITPF